jgi:hypothetical protein
MKVGNLHCNSLLGSLDWSEGAACGAAIVYCV